MTQPRLWRNRNFRFFIAASTFAQLGSGVFAVAFPWFATLLTRDPLLIGMVAMAPQVPWLLFALPVGVWTDWLDHGRTIMVGNGLRAGLTLAVLVLALRAEPGLQAVWMLAGLAFLQGSVEVLRDNTAQTILPQVVAKSQLEAANATLQSTDTLLGQFIGPPLAGAMIGVTIALPFGFEAVMLMGSVLLTGLMQLSPHARGVRQQFWPAMREGLRWLWSNVALRRLGLVLGAYNFLYQVIWAVMVLYAQDSLRLGPVGYGALLSALAVGGLAGGMAAPSILRQIGARRGLFMSVTGFCLSTSVLIFTDNPWLAGAALIGDAFTGMTWNVATVSYRQRNIPAPLLGRVNAVYRLLGSGPRPAGSFLGGALVAVAAPLGPIALHLPFAFATLGGIAMLIYSARNLHLD